MLTYVLEFIGLIITFSAGVIVGVHNVVPVDKAISTVETAEKAAMATLAKITAHKTA